MIDNESGIGRNHGLVAPIPEKAMITTGRVGTANDHQLQLKSLLINQGANFMVPHKE